MKKIEAIIRPERLALVRKALEEIGYSGLTITEVKGHGAQRGVTQTWRGNTFTVDLLPKVKLELVVRDDQVRPIMTAIRENAVTGEIGDGKLFVTPVEEVMRIRTAEEGEVAL